MDDSGFFSVQVLSMALMVFGLTIVPIGSTEVKEAKENPARERGFILTEEDRDVSILDCDHNRKVLVELFQARLPSARILRFENTHKRQTEFILRGVQVFITNLAEILALPIPKKKTP